MPTNPGARYPSKTKAQKVKDTAVEARTLVGGVCVLVGCVAVLLGLPVPGIVAVYVGGWLIGRDQRGGR